MNKSEWPPNIPESLTSICLSYCAHNLEKTVCLSGSGTDDLLQLNSSICFPPSVGDALLSTLGRISRGHLGLFADPSAISFRRLDLRSINNLSDNELDIVLRHYPSELQISSEQLTGRSISSLNKMGQNLVALSIVNCTNIFPDKSIESSVDEDDFIDLQWHQISEDAESVARLECPKLRMLAVRDMALLRESQGLIYFNRPTLVRLDLSDSLVNVGLLHGGLRTLPSLQILTLHNVELKNVDKAFRAICQAQTLRSLDLGQSRQESPILYDCNVTSCMTYLVSHLPQLTWLDISGTNLAGWIPEPSISHQLHPSTSEKSKQCPIPGLEGRHLTYLGLLNCAYKACERQNIPADQVTGDANENQILLSVLTYIERHEHLLISLNHLFHQFKYAECSDHKRALDGILAAMRTYPEDRAIQISGSATLFYIIKSSSKHNFSTKLKKIVIDTLLDAMEKHITEPTMLRNGCLTLCHFRIPQDVMHNYQRVVVLMLKVILAAYDPIENFVQRIVVYLLNSLSCQVDHCEKQLVGQLGAFPTVLKVIRERISRGLCDEVMEVSWSMLWNVTATNASSVTRSLKLSHVDQDETALNCERFIIEKGLETFVECLDRFKNHEELLRNMMGLLGNVAEVDYLRHHLMESRYIVIFNELLSSNSDGIEVSYNACGVLAHMMSDGPQAWTVGSPSRDAVMENMRQAISRWELKSKRNINYRSFKPIMHLIPCHDAPQSQHWAIWALCNLTKVYKSKYCPLVESDGGIKLLVEFCDDHRPTFQVKALAQKVIDRCSRFRASGGNSASEDERMEAEEEIVL